jgi:hypothetical protein
MIDISNGVSVDYTIDDTNLLYDHIRLDEYLNNIEL